MCPDTFIPGSSFEGDCNLRASCDPMRDIDMKGESVWIMKWRGQEGGMRLDRLVRGDDVYPASFVFTRTPNESAEGGFVGLKIEFMMSLGGNNFIFHGHKTAELESKKDGRPVGMPWMIEYKWDSIRS